MTMWRGIAAIAVAGCSASALDVPADPQGTSAPIETSACERNFYDDEVVCYPTDDIGVRFRVPLTGKPSGYVGARLPNVSVFGYLEVDPSQPIDTSIGPRAISMAEFYDPESRRLRVLQLLRYEPFCPSAVSEARAIVAYSVELAHRGVLTLAITAHTSSEDPATAGDLDTWIEEQQINYTAAIGTQPVLDVDPSCNPVFVYVDARSMEVLGAAYDNDGKYAQLEQWVDWASKNPARP